MYIFDLDGTLLDSNGLWKQVDLEFLTRRGLEPTPEYFRGVAGSIFPVAAAFARELYHLPDTPEEIMAEWEELAARQYRDVVPLKPGAGELLERYRREGARMSMFTACRPALCRAALGRFGLEGYFEKLVFAEEIGLDKHDPRCFLRLSEILGVPPGSCTLLDDSPSNCATASAAGMRTVGVYDRFFHDRQEELQAVCTRYVRSLQELLD